MKSRKILSLALIIAMIAGMFVFASITVGAADPDGSTANPFIDTLVLSGTVDDPVAAKFGSGTAPAALSITAKAKEKDAAIAAAELKLVAVSSNPNVLKVAVNATDKNKIDVTVVGGSVGDGDTVTVTISHAAATLKGEDDKFYKCIAADAITQVYTVTRDAAVVAAVADSYAVTVKAKNAAGEESVITLDFDAETLKTSNAPVAGYTLNGGKKWVRLSKPINNTTTGESITKILNAGGADVIFTSALASNGKGVGENAVLWQLGSIAKRPKAPKIAVQYGLFNADGAIVHKDAEHEDTYKWTLRVNNLPLVATGDADVWEGSNILVATAFKDKKTADTEAKAETATSPQQYIGFTAFNYEATDVTAVGGLTQAILKTTGKTSRFVYLAKTAPVINDPAASTATPAPTTWSFTPGSAAKKLNVSSTVKLPAAKVDYKKGIVTLKAGTGYSYITDVTGLISTAAAAKAGLPFDDADGVVGVIKGVDPGEFATVTIWTEAANRKAPSAETTIKVWGYSPLSSANQTAIKAGLSDKGKFKLPKGYEVKVDDAWTSKFTVGPDFDSVEGSTYEVRRAATAKFVATSKNADNINDKNLVRSDPSMKLSFTSKVDGEKTLIGGVEIKS